MSRLALLNGKLSLQTTQRLKNIQRDYYAEGFIQLLNILPELKSLALPLLPYSFHRTSDFQYLIGLSGLTKLSIRSEDNCKKMLNELVTRLKLVELDTKMYFDANSVGITKSFGEL